jgi:O-antigen ligase
VVDVPQHGRLTFAVPRRWVAAALPAGTGCFIGLALLFGGGAEQGFWSDAFLQVLSLPLLALAIWTATRVPFDRAAKWPLAVGAAVLLLPLLQLVPLPPSVWTALPARESIAAGYQAAGVPLPWLPISLAPAATWRGFLSLLPPTAVFLAVLSLGPDTRRRLVFVVLVIALLSVIVDLLQIMGGPNSRLYFFAITNVGQAVGFFANRNHNAAFLYSAIVLAAAWGLGLPREGPGVDRRAPFIVGAVIVGAVIGLALTASRAGLAIGLLAGLSCIGLVAGQRRSERRRRWLITAVAGNVLALLIAFQFGFVQLAQRVERTDLITDLRWPVATATLDAADAAFPIGTGFGSFVSEFRIYEPRSILAPAYVNHAHDDWLEAALEGGVPALLIAAGFLAWFGTAAAAAWREPGRGRSFRNAVLPRAAAIVVLLLLLHSVVDYPLRTAALMVLFALACGILVPPPVTRVPDTASERDLDESGVGADEPHLPRGPADRIAEPAERPKP